MTAKRMISRLLVCAMLVCLVVAPMVAVRADGDGPIEIRTVADLYAINNNLSGSFILMNDIDLTDATTNPNSVYNLNGMGWRPIGGTASFGTGDFKGVFNGAGHTIKGLNIHATYSSGYYGLFSHNKGTIKNLYLSNVDITTKNASAIGCVAAACDGTISNVHVTNGKVETRGSLVGGLTGYGTVRLIELCSNNADIHVTAASQGSIVGGLIGRLGERNSSLGNITKSFNSGSISCESNTGSSPGLTIGGIAGSGTQEGRYSGSVLTYYYSKISDCYNSGSISIINNSSSSIWAKGISSLADITSCCNTGTCSADYYGIGTDMGKASSNNYAMKEETSTSMVTYLTANQFKDIAFMPGLNFDSTWFLDPDAEYPYPQLQSNPQDADPRIDTMVLAPEPTKKAYRTDDPISAEGGVLHVYHVDGSEKDITVTEDMLSGYDMSTPGVQDVTVTYKNRTVSYQITVTQRAEVEDLILISGPDQSTFVRGTAFDYAGAVARICYADETTEDIELTPDNTTGGNIDQSGDYTITYEYGGKTVSFDVHVVPLQVTGLSIASPPDTTTYTEGQEIDPTGLSVTAVYNSGATKALGDNEYELNYSSAAGTQTVTVSYQYLVATFDVEFTHTPSDEWTVTTQPTCLNAGEKTLYCQNCHAVLDSAEIEALGHDWCEWETVSSPSCTDKGSRKHSCSRCETVEYEDVDPVGHTWKTEYETDTEPTCSQEGSESKHCSVCGVPLESSIRPIAKLDHDYGEWTVVKRATCAEAGREERSCSACHHVDTKEIATLPHTWNMNYQEPTCTKAGGWATHCATCGAIGDMEVIEATGHEWGQPSYVWSNDGKSVIASRTCTHDSSHVDSETANTTMQITKAPTFTEMGEAIYTAAFKNPAFETQTKTLKNIPMLSKKTQPLVVKGKTAKVKYSKLKKKKQTVAQAKILVVSNAQGALTYAKVSGNKKISVNKTTGKVIVKKGLKKGKYKLQFKVTAAGNKAYKAGSKTVTAYVKVK